MMQEANYTPAADKYTAEIGERVSVIEGNFNCTVSFIGEYVSNYMRRNKVKPVVIVDYLQIIQAAGQGSTKEAGQVAYCCPDNFLYMADNGSRLNTDSMKKAGDHTPLFLMCRIRAVEAL